MGNRLVGVIKDVYLNINIVFFICYNWNIFISMYIKNISTCITFQLIIWFVMEQFLYRLVLITITMLVILFLKLSPYENVCSKKQIHVDLSISLLHFNAKLVTFNYWELQMNMKITSTAICICIACYRFELCNKKFKTNKKLVILMSHYFFRISNIFGFKCVQYDNTKVTVAHLIQS